MNIQDDIINQAARQMAKDIDTEILMTAMDWKPFALSSGTVYGTKYLTVHPGNGQAWNEMMAWMIEQFGPSACDGVWTPNMRWYANNAKFWFRDERDLTMFILKWS